MRPISRCPIYYDPDIQSPCCITPYKGPRSHKTLKFVIQKDHQQCHDVTKLNGPIVLVDDPRINTIKLCVITALFGVFSMTNIKTL